MRLRTMHKRRRRKLNRRNAIPVSYPVVSLRMINGELYRIVECYPLSKMEKTEPEEMAEIAQSLSRLFFENMNYETIDNGDGVFRHHFYADVLDAESLTDVLREEILDESI